MCRRNRLWGWILIALGVGVLIGTCVEGGFLCSLICGGLVALGIGTMRR